MNRTWRKYTALGLCLLNFASGCAPTQPFYFGEDGDLSHYINVATDIEYPDVCAQPLDEVTATPAPLTLANASNFKYWDLTLEEVTRLTLANSEVIRGLGGRINDQGQNIAQTTPQNLTAQGGAGAGNATTTFDPALTSSGYGGGTGDPNSGTGVEAALSEFDTQLNSSILWQNNDRPQNFRGAGVISDFFSPQFRQDIGRASTGLRKTMATGGTAEFRHNTNYDYNNNGSRRQPSDWFTNFEAFISQPLLQGAGVQYNRINGPRDFQQAAGNFADQIDGVLIARVREDISLTQFENGVNNLMRDVEDAYWELYFAYRDLEAKKIGLDSAQETWKKIKAKADVGQAGGEADKEAQARSQYYVFRSEVELAQTGLFRVENRLRYLMGLPATDGRLIRPADEPTTAPVHIDWNTVHAEAIARRVEVRRQKWEIKRRELELIGARNLLLPRLDAFGQYRWLGAGDELIDSDGTGVAPFLENSNAFENLTTGNFQEWEMGLQFTMPLGMHRGMATVRHHQLLLTKARAVLADMELEVSHQISDAVRDVEFNYGVAQTRFNGWAASQDEVNAVESIYEAGRVTLDLLLDAQRRRALAESAFYRSLADYNRAVMRLHYNKGSLLEYNGVYLAEGPWPGKAHFDALRRARQRDASLFLDYGFTRPQVISQGLYPQMQGTTTGGLVEMPPTGANVTPSQPTTPPPAPTEEELIPTPLPEPITPPAAPAATGAGTVVPMPLASQAAPVAPATAIEAIPALPSANAAGQLPPNPFLSAPQSSAGPVATAATPLTYEPQAYYPLAESAAEVAAGAWER
jgi:outer membrane protein TolC